MKIGWIILFIVLIILVVVYDFICPNELPPSLILALTAVIILWYTYETHLIRIYNNELIKRSRRPSIGYRIFPLEKDARETGFEIVNYSEHPVAVKVFCNFKLKNEIIKNEWPAYDGQEYWNLQYNQMKFGHFNVINLLKEKYESDEINQLKKVDYKTFKELVSSENKYSSSLNNIEMEIKIISQNSLGDIINYPIDHYKFDVNRMIWISTLTSKKPYWEET